jgi:hypothetical protein
MHKAEANAEANNHPLAVQMHPVRSGNSGSQFLHRLKRNSSFSKGSKNKPLVCLVIADRLHLQNFPIFMLQFFSQS